MKETIKSLFLPYVLLYKLLKPVFSSITTLVKWFFKVLFYPVFWCLNRIPALVLPASFGLGKKNAHFMGFFGRFKLLSGSNTGLVLDGKNSRLSDENSYKNLVMVAATGWGKSSGFVIPNILMQNEASMVITDPSGDIFDKTSGSLAARGYKVRVLNPLDLKHSIKFNPLAGLESPTDIDEIAHILVKTAFPNSTDPFWNQGAETIISVLARTLSNGGKDLGSYQNLANVLHLLNNFEDGEPLSEFISKYADDVTYSQFKGFVSNAENTMQGLLATAKTSLKAFADPSLASLTATNDFEFQSLRDEKTALFLIFPQNRLSYYSFLMNIFYTRLFHFCLDDEKFDPEGLPIYFLLDEFGHLHIPDFSSIITTTRKRNISISIILQSISQLEKQYGREDAETILSGGIASRLFSSGLDNKTNRMLAETLGLKRHEIRTSADGLQVKDDPLIDSYLIRTMRDDEALFLYANKPAVKLKIKRYFKSAKFRTETDLPPCSLPEKPLYSVDYYPLSSCTRERNSKEKTR